MKDGIAKVKSEIKGVMGIMQDNISKVLDRGSKLEDLQDKSGKLNTGTAVLYIFEYIYIYIYIYIYLFTFCMLFSLHFNIPEILNYKHDVVCTIINVAYNSDG